MTAKELYSLLQAIAGAHPTAEIRTQDGAAIQGVILASAEWGQFDEEIGLEEEKPPEYVLLTEWEIGKKDELHTNTVNMC